MLRIKELCKEILFDAVILGDNKIKYYQFPYNVPEIIEQWEQHNCMILPEAYKEFLLFSDGFENDRTELYSLKNVTKILVQNEFNGYFEIGKQTIDGSLLLLDEKGDFYYEKGENGLEQVTFEEYVKTWILDEMEELIENNNIIRKYPTISIKEAFSKSEVITIDYVYYMICTMCDNPYQEIDEIDSFEGNMDSFMVKRKNAFRELKLEDMVEVVGENHYVYKYVEIEDRGMCEWCQETDKYL